MLLTGFPLEFFSMKKMTKPLIVSCAGCCHGGALAEDIATTLVQQGHVDKIAIAAVAAKSPHHIAKIKQGNQLIAIDGCALQCIKHCLKQCGIEDYHYFDIAKRLNALPQTAKQSVLQSELQVTAQICRELAPYLVTANTLATEVENSNIIALFPCAKY